ncbi:unnamed protein product [Durusdinium trenchii]|uniref:Uncharacterized membrane protein STKORF319 n=2 Tax=Durusdinium trenchii TaxID=1381693 RepID=A0ABP0NY60_9DINO
MLFFMFLVAASMLLHYRESSYWWQHIFSMSFWLLITIVFMGTVGAQEGSEAMGEFISGYLTELALTFENVFIYEMILVSFRVPRKVARDMLFIVSFFQMFFQLWLFMFMAKALKQIESLPYLVGAWLIYLGIDSLRESDEESNFDPETSGFYRALRWVFGSRLEPHYGDSLAGPCKGDRKEMKAEVLKFWKGSLIVAMFLLELDVTLAKIEDIPSNFIGWTSSVFVAFALSDLYFLVSQLFKNFQLVRSGISILLIFFGALLLLRNEVQISDTAEIAGMLSIVLLSVIFSQPAGRSFRFYINMFGCSC